MNKLNINYQFSLMTGTKDTFSFNFDVVKKGLKKISKKRFPKWTSLGNEQCPNCPLTIDRCPLAVNLVDIIEKFDGLNSYEKVHLLISTKEREVSIKTTIQKGMSSLMGLAIATSNCPHTSFFTPMAYFHKPLASIHETVFRSVSSYLLSQYFLQEEGRDTLFKLDGLTEIYRNLKVVNQYIARRLRLVTESDSAVNAIIILDGYAQALPLMMDSALDEIKEMYSQYYEDVC